MEKNKIFRTMKVMFFLMLMFLMQLKAEVFSQNQALTLKMKNCNVEEFLSEVRKQTGVRFMFRQEVVKDIPRFDVEVSRTPLDEVLEKTLGTRGLECVFEDGVVILNLRQAQSVKEKRVFGVVKDETGHVLPGVTVMLKGTTVGASTDMDGKYSVVLPEGVHTLVFTMVGMETREEPVGDRTEINVSMKEEVSEMDEVVVTGYFNQAKNSFTGAARTITSEELQTAGNQNILSALQNIDPSFVKLENNQMGSNPNAIPDFQIRGAGSIGGMRDEYSGNPNMPVFIVDGFETTAEKVFDMDPYRVSTITLLKGR